MAIHAPPVSYRIKRSIFDRRKVDSGARSDLSLAREADAYFFPAERDYFQKRAKDGAESRFQGGSHFRTDKEVGLDLGKKAGAMIVQKVRTDGADDASPSARRKKPEPPIIKRPLQPPPTNSLAAMMAHPVFRPMYAL